MNEIDPGLKAITSIAGMAGLAGPIIWYALGRGFRTISVLVGATFVLVAYFAANWSVNAGVTVGYEGKPPTFSGLLSYYIRSFGLLYCGLSGVMVISRTIAVRKE